MTDKEYKEKINKIYKIIREKNERIKFLEEQKEQEELINEALIKLALEKTQVNINKPKEEKIIRWG